MSESTSELPPIVALNNATLLQHVGDFADSFFANPLSTLQRSPTPFILVLLCVIIPPFLRWMFPQEEVKSGNLCEDLDSNTLKEEVEEVGETAQEYWELGVSKQAVAVAAGGILRAIHFTPEGTSPNAQVAIDTFMKAICEPVEGRNYKPKYAVFLETCVLDEKSRAKVMAGLKDVGVAVTTLAELQRTEPEIASVKPPPEPVNVKYHPFKAQLTPIRQDVGPQVVIPYNEQPPRQCLHCHKQVELAPGKKASQCSACKASIYCTTECAKKDWLNHKKVCPQFRVCMDNMVTWDLHNFPFTFYNKSKILCNYNVVPFLTTVRKHNIGLYQRLCGCFAQASWGHLNAKVLFEFQRSNPNPEQMFSYYGLDQEMFPLSQPLVEGFEVNDITSWESYYKARNHSLGNPAALLLEVPLTIWHLIKEFHLKNAVELQPGERRKVTVHLIGAEKECDLLPLFECLLPLIPRIDLAIHMIGNTIGTDFPPNQRAMAIKSASSESSIFMSLTTSLYQANHLDGTAFQLPDTIPAEVLATQNFGAGPPDLIIALNAAMIRHQEWGPCLKMIIDAKAKFVWTERMEQFGNTIAGVLPNLGAGLSVAIHPNPFKQPLFEFSRDINFPAWSNGFIMGIGEGFPASEKPEQDLNVE